MEIDESELEERRHEVVSELRSSICKNAKCMKDYW